MNGNQVVVALLVASWIVVAGMVSGTVVLLATGKVERAREVIARFLLVAGASFALGLLVSLAYSLAGAR